MKAALEVTGLTVRHGPRAALDDVSLDLAAGERLAVIGPSGAGKTTLLRVVAGLVAPERGVVRIGDAVVTDGAAIRVPPERRGVGLVFQDLAPWPTFTVEAALAFCARGTRAERRGRARDLAGRVGLGRRLDATPDALSGGEQQRLALARALAGAPSLLLLDEPFAHLDLATRRDLVDLLLDLASGVALVVVTHDARDVLDLAGRVHVLEDGRTAEAGAVAGVLARPARRVTVDLLGLGRVVAGAPGEGGLVTPLGTFAVDERGARAALVRPDGVEVVADPSGPGVVRRVLASGRVDRPWRVVVAAAADAACVVEALAADALAPGARVRVVPAAPLHGLAP